MEILVYLCTMETQDDNIKIVNNEVLVDKLDSMSMDIKTYVNINAMIYAHTNPERGFISGEDIHELLEIRRRIKTLSRKLRESL